MVLGGNGIAAGRLHGEKLDGLNVANIIVAAGGSLADDMARRFRTRLLLSVNFRYSQRKYQPLCAASASLDAGS